MSIREAIEQAQYYNGVKQNDDSYFAVGSVHDVVVSNSSASYINPDEGGSPAKFDAYLSEEEEFKLSNHLEKGKLLHRYIKDPRYFATTDENNKPSEAVCGIMESLLGQLDLENGDLPVPQGMVTAFDLLKDKVISCAREAQWQNNWGDDAVFRNLKKDGEAYFNFLVENNGKIIMSKEVGQSVDGMKLSIESSEYRDFLLDGDGLIYKEIPLFWEFPTEAGVVKCKSLIDNLLIDEEAKMIQITDLKSTSKAASTYMGSVRFGLHPIEGTPSKIFTDGPFQYLRVYRQIASYGEAVKRAILSKLPNGGQWSIEYRVLAVESKAPHELQMFTPRGRWLILGWEEYSECLLRVAKHLRSREQE